MVQGLLFIGYKRFNSFNMNFVDSFYKVSG